MSAPKDSDRTLDFLNAKEERRMNQDLIEICKDEMISEETILQMLRESDFDKVSKDSIRLRAHERYKRLLIIRELEEA